MTWLIWYLSKASCRNCTVPSCYKIPTNSDIQNFFSNQPKILTGWLYWRVMGPTAVDKTANSVDPSGAVCTVFPELSKKLRLIMVPWCWQASHCMLTVWLGSSVGRVLVWYGRFPGLESLSGHLFFLPLWHLATRFKPLSNSFAPLGTDKSQTSSK